MPRGDKTGPNGLGSMTGRGAGFCAGNKTAGFENEEFTRRGQGMGRRLGNGNGMGRGNRGGFGFGAGRGIGYRQQEAIRTEAENTDLEERISSLEDLIKNLSSEVKKLHDKL